MWYVYFLKSSEHDWRYVGSTRDVNQRIMKHNTGKVQSTKHYHPFELVAYIVVNTEAKARNLEKYFKTGSGIAVLKKRILQLYR